MASELTARLYGRNFASTSSTSSVTSDCSRNGETVNSKRESAVSSSGYVGDGEQRSPVVTIDFLDQRRKRHSGSSGERDVKRQKQLESQYLAATAKDQLARSGIDLPKHNLKGATIDLSNVDHLYSKEVADSPFLPCPESMPLVSFFESDHVLSLLIRLTEASYNPPTSVEKTADQLEYESSTSSVTESENTDEDEKRTSDNRTKSNHFSLGDALSLSTQARLVTLGCSPYVVVHTNAAFSQITGIPSVRALGRPVGDLLEDGMLLHCLKSCREEFVVKSLDNLSFKSKNTQKGSPTECNIIVSPVGSSSDALTHLSIEIRVGDSNEVQPILSSKPALEPAFSVLG